MVPKFGSVILTTALPFIHAGMLLDTGLHTRLTGLVSGGGMGRSRVSPQSCPQAYNWGKKWITCEKVSTLYITPSNATDTKSGFLRAGVTDTTHGNSLSERDECMRNSKATLLTKGYKQPGHIEKCEDHGFYCMSEPFRQPWEPLQRWLLVISIHLQPITILDMFSITVKHSLFRKCNVATIDTQNSVPKFAYYALFYSLQNNNPRHVVKY